MVRELWGEHFGLILAGCLTARSASSSRSPGLDGHDRGAKTVASVLRDHGMEVIYTGLHQTPEMIAEVAVQEDVDVVGLSILSGAHMALFPRVKEELEKRGMTDALLVGGGIIPGDDMEKLETLGYAESCSARGRGRTTSRSTFRTRCNGVGAKKERGDEGD